MTSTECTAAFDRRIERIANVLRSNGDPSEVALILHGHYLDAAQDCLAEDSPNINMRLQWLTVAAKYEKLRQEFRELEDAQ